MGNHEFDAGLRRPGQPGHGPVRRDHQPARVVRSGSTSPPTCARRATAPTPSRHAGSRTSATCEVGFVGAVTEDLPSLVSPDGIADIEVTDIVDAVNASADALEADGADVIVLLVHEGAASTTLRRGDRPELRVRPDRQRRQRQHRRHRVRAHAPRLQPLLPGPRMGHGGPRGHRASGRLRRSVRHVPQPADLHRRHRHRRRRRTDPERAEPEGADHAVRGQLPGGPGGHADRQRRHRRSPNVLGAVELGKIAGPFNRAKFANGTHREPRWRVRPSATWSPRSSAGPPRRRRPVAPRSRS